MKKYNLKLWIISFCICIMAIIIIAKDRYTEKEVWNELLKLDANTSIDDLKENGYIDVSQVMDSPNNEIDSFLKRAKDKKSGILRIATILDGKLCAKILIYDQELNAIKMWTMYPNQQQADSPGKCFSPEAYEIKETDITTVFLKNIPDPSIPNNQTTLLDEKLYSYH